MKEPIDRILRALSDPAVRIADEDVEEIAKECPYFVLPAILALRQGGAGMDDGLKHGLMERIALNSANPQGAFMLADADYEEWAQFYPSGSRSVSTEDAITKFLETYGHSDPHEEALLERLIFNPAPDYSSMLAREEEASMPAVPSLSDDDSQDALINSFILKHRRDESQLLPREDGGRAGDENADEAASAVSEEERHAPSQASSIAYDSSLSESLAKIYIKQKRYDKAFEIIHTLSLNNTKKNAYFADQLRFLKKLMLNRSSANKGK